MINTNLLLISGSISLIVAIIFITQFAKNPKNKTEAIWGDRFGKAVKIGTLKGLYAKIYRIFKFALALETIILLVVFFYQIFIKK